MSWITDRIAERKAAQDRKALIFSEGENVFAALWVAILALTKEATANGFPVHTNGSPHARAVAYTPPGDFQRQLEISLHREEGEIIAQGPDGNIKLLLDVGTDGVVGLKTTGPWLSLEQAAREILDPFLFPDLAKKTFPR